MTLSRRSFLGLAAAGALSVAGRSPGWRDLLARRPPGEWSPGPDLPWSTQEVYSTVRGSEVVVAGGLRSGSESSTRFETLAGTAFMDPDSGAWREGPDLPAPRHHLVLAAAGETVFGFGGFVGESLRDGFRFRRDVFALVGGSWRRMGEMPTPLGETVAATVQGRVHLVTGSVHPPERSGSTETGGHIVFEPASGSWSTARPAPTARSSATGAVIDDRIYVVGGRRQERGVTNLGVLERYDPEADEWTSLRPLPRPSGGLAGAALDGTLYCFGGEHFGPDGGGVYGETWAYRPEADEWDQVAPLPTPRHGLAGAAAAGRVYAIGGNTAAAVGDATSRVVEAFTPGAPR
jgi:hypothetical protein